MSTVVKDSTAPIQNPSGGRGWGGHPREVRYWGVRRRPSNPDPVVDKRPYIMSLSHFVLHTLSDFQPNIMDFPVIDVQCSKTKLLVPQICSLLMANFHTFLFQKDTLFKMLNSKILFLLSKTQDLENHTLFRRPVTPSAGSERVVSELKQQNDRKKLRMAKLCVTNVTGLLIGCFVMIFT